MTPPPRKPPTHTQEQVRDISVEVYKIRLRQDSSSEPPDNVERMLRKDREADPEDNGKRLRRRAGAYDPLTRAYLKVLEGQLK